MLGFDRKRERERERRVQRRSCNAPSRAGEDFGFVTTHRQVRRMRYFSSKILALGSSILSPSAALVLFERFVID